ncbi:hypothetical protein PGT21_011504 [Puccinia graminis f. sp. tritici]|uniref:Uncharacterized protein n=1 Tax=Puccinia graminis f. sp. tritici TaxID=56615 RepID=A0A5B0NBZ9_PUCGR|nr:hypothetical protein PGT21_011504 [Puccinia graminis f. sp. tritici]
MGIQSSTDEQLSKEQKSREKQFTGRAKDRENCVDRPGGCLLSMHVTTSKQQPPADLYDNKKLCIHLHSPSCPSLSSSKQQPGAHPTPWCEVVFSLQMLLGFLRFASPKEEIVTTPIYVKKLLQSTREMHLKKKNTTKFVVSFCYKS